MRNYEILEAALICLDDGCPTEPSMQLCRMEDDVCDDSCRRCWLNYLIWISNGRKNDPYRYDRIYEGGMVG